MLGMLLQRFDLEDHLELPAEDQDHADHQAGRLPHPGPAAARAAARAAPRTDGLAGGNGTSAAVAAPAVTAATTPLVHRHGTPLLVLFGSNLGTAESIATRLAREGTERGFDVTLGALDDHVDALPTDGALLVVCSSYNGTPPDNAAAFCRWISGAAPGRLPTAWRTRCSAAATPSGPRRTRPCRRSSTSSWRRTAARRVHPRGEGNAAADFDAPVPLLARRPLGRRSPRHSTCRPRSPRCGTGGPAAVDHADQPPADQPGHRVLPGPPGAGAGEPRADPRGGRRRPATVDPAPRDRAAAGLVVPCRGPPRGAAAQQHRPDPPGDGAVRPRRRAVRHDHPQQRHAHPPADRRAGATAGGARQLRRAAGRGHPGRHRGPRPLHRRPRAAGGAAGADR